MRFLSKSPYKKNGFVYQKKFNPNVKRNGNGKRVQQAKQRVKLYTENWDAIRKRVYARDGYRCVLCGKKGKLHAHHIVPVRISKDNSMSNLVSVCDKCHRRLEQVGFAILERGGGRAEIRRAELEIIMEAKRKRLNQYMAKREKLHEQRQIDQQSAGEDNEQSEDNERKIG